MTTIDDDHVLGPLHRLFVEAAETEHRLPRAMAKVTTTYWPDYKAEWLSYADDTTQVRLQATRQQVSRYNRAIELAGLLQPEQRRIVWAVAFSAARRHRGPAWTKLGRLLNIDRRQVRSRYEAALSELLSRMMRN
tara:strand:+ start:991 stop:1395 length:405 start_codon:yes stop_codon:yes gene_type:complete